MKNLRQRIKILHVNYYSLCAIGLNKIKSLYACYYPIEQLKWRLVGIIYEMYLS